MSQHRSGVSRSLGPGNPSCNIEETAYTCLGFERSAGLFSVMLFWSYMKDLPNDMDVSPGVGKL